MKFAVLAACLLPLPLAAFEPALPSPSDLTGTRNESNARYHLATGPWQAADRLTVEAEGAVLLRAWKMTLGELATLDLLTALRSQIEADGYRVLYECETDACGGFDFRYEADLLPEPDMHVDLGDFRYLSAARGTGTQAEHLALMISRSADTGFVHLAEVTPATGPLPAAGPAAPADAAAPTGAGGSGDFGATLEQAGSVALEDLAFPSGSSDLAPGDYPSLAVLAAWLATHPEATITLVGHTDAQGSLAANVALSKRRAASVAGHLVSEYAIAPDRIASDGVGFLAPRGSNLTDAGRTKNRRVEAILTSTR